jgi:hypothetical protein
MQDNLTRIVTALRRIQEEGGAGNFVILVADRESNCYVQFATERGNPMLRAEAVSNAFLVGITLDAGAQAQLEALGWEPPETDNPASPNYFRQWRAVSDHDRQRIAREVMRTFSVYGVDSSQPLNVTIELA